jgi:hypothetical protein
MKPAMAGPGAAEERAAAKAGPGFPPEYAGDHGQQTLRKQGVANGVLNFSPKGGQMADERFPCVGQPGRPAKCAAASPIPQ